MNDKTQALQDDIAFMRDLAQAGASAPIVSGFVLALCGGVYGSLSLVHFLWNRFADPEGWMLATLWLGSTGLFILAMSFVILPKVLKKPGISSPANRAVGFTWNATGWIINLLLLCALILSWRLGNSLPFALFPSVIACVYGGAWLTSARMSGQSWMRWPMLGSFAFALLLALMVTSPYLWLAFASAFFLTMLVPGIVLMRKEPSLVV